MAYRNINKFEIETLEAQSCTAEDWAKLMVKEDFNPYSVRNSHFSGQVKLGIFNDRIETEHGIFKPSGIYHSFVQNSVIDDNCLISHVKTLANYNIAQNVVVDNVGSLVVIGESCFGNGVVVDVLNEAGGREIMIYDHLSAQIAYIMVMFRHDKELIEALKKLVEDYVDTKLSPVGHIEKNVQITDTTTVKNVFIGESAKIDGALLLENASICSTSFSPVYIGHGVSAKNFIINSGSRLDGSAIINHCFIGQGVQVGKQFTADNSLFFANSEAFQGEACSIFAGPYTVTHHKSTLLIAGMYSFYNAGSGTNESNHMYKLGPVHQGILERGSKTGSYSYLLWPSRTGVFSVIIGKHYSNFDSSDLPFAYIVEQNGKTKLTPGFNLCTVGTKRDSEKWPKRDRRLVNDRLDLINFDLYNPFIIGKILAGRQIVLQLAERVKDEQEYLIYKGVQILGAMLKTSARYYEMAIKIYLGNELIHKLGETENLRSIEAVRKRLESHPEEFYRNWADLAGMIIPLEKVESIAESVKNLKIDSLKSLSETLQSEFLNYRKYAWEWCANLILEFKGFNVNSLTAAQLNEIINEWQENTIRLNQLILKDAENEFSRNSKVGYGFDGSEETRDKDFEMVRDKFEENLFVRSILIENEDIKGKALELLSFLDNV